MIVRLAEEADLPALAELSRNAMSFALPQEPGCYDADDGDAILAHLRTYLEPEEGLALIAAAGDEAIGFVGCKLGAAPCDDETLRAAVDILAVAPGHRGHGIGTQLMRELMAMLATHGIAGADVRVASDNQAAVRFWRRAGFQDTVLTLSADARPAASPEA